MAVFLAGDDRATNRLYSLSGIICCQMLKNDIEISTPLAGMQRDLVDHVAGSAEPLFKVA